MMIKLLFSLSVLCVAATGKKLYQITIILYSLNRYVNKIPKSHKVKILMIITDHKDIVRDFFFSSSVSESR